MIASSGATIRNSVVMVNDLYQDESPPKPGDPSIGTGRNAVIEGAIIDKNARIGNEFVITPKANLRTWTATTIIFEMECW